MPGVPHQLKHGQSLVRVVACMWCAWLTVPLVGDGCSDLLDEEMPTLNQVRDAAFLLGTINNVVVTMLT